MLILQNTRSDMRHFRGEFFLNELKEFLKLIVIFNSYMLLTLTYNKAMLKISFLLGLLVIIIFIFYFLFSFLLTINLKLIIVHVETKIVNKEAATKQSTLLLTLCMVAIPLNKVM